MANVSTSVGAVMKPAGFENGQGVLSAHYAKDAGDAQWKDDPGMKKFLAFLDKYYPDADRTEQPGDLWLWRGPDPDARFSRCAATT